MAGDDIKSDQLKSLISGALAPKVAAVEEPGSITEGGPSNITELVDIYFELDEPAERDALFEQVASLTSEEATAFLKEMATQDEDRYVRSAAAAELCQRGLTTFESTLHADFNDPNDPELFAQAALALSSLHGTEFFESLEKAFSDPQREPSQRAEALLAMESLDAERTLSLVTTRLRAVTSLADLDDEFFEQAALLYARHDYQEAGAIFDQLAQHASAPDLPAADKDDVLSMIDEARSLFEFGSPAS